MNAAVLQMPATVLREAKRRQNRVELAARHSWIMGNYSKWETVELDGVRHTSVEVAMLKDLIRAKWPDRYPALSAKRMQENIREKRKVIVKRNQAKAWLRSLGADLDKIKTPEDALFFVVDYLQAQRG